MAFYISRISMVNVRSFGDPDLDLTIGSGGAEFYTPRPHTILIGANGTGKTTLLRAIAIGLADEKDAGGLLAEPTGQFVAEGALQATIQIELQESGGGEKRTLTTVIRSENGQDVLEEKKPATFGAGLVCGYGISRANNEGSDTGRPYRVLDSVYTLFNYTEPLIGTELGLRRLDDFLRSEWYPRVMESIKEALGLDRTVTIALVKGGGVRVSGPGIGKDIPLEGWADGYSKTLAWILDLYVWAMRADCITSTGDITGIVLLDELEQHLHPSMQVGLLSRLGILLPHVQIIATTHSPLVALGAKPEELVVLKRVGDRVRAHESVRDFHEYSVEDMLADPRLFDSSVFGPEVSEKLGRYRELVRKSPSKRSSQETAELGRLGSDLTALEIPEVRGSSAFKELQAILKRHNL